MTNGHSIGGGGLTTLRGFDEVTGGLDTIMTSRAGSTVSWTSYNLPQTLNQGANSSQFRYGPARARYKQINVNAGVSETSYYIGGLYERLLRPSSLTEHKHYILAAGEAVAIHLRRSSGVHETLSLHQDHLGSVDTVTYEGGGILRLSYDAFGKRRDDDWSGPPDGAELAAIGNTTRRGYTFHEHLDNLELIHMNGRVYDPSLGRFLSADPFVQAPFNLQSLNRYSYVQNNPLSYIDPSGFWDSLLVFIGGGGSRDSLPKQYHGGERPRPNASPAPPSPPATPQPPPPELGAPQSQGVELIDVGYSATDDLTALRENIATTAESYLGSTLFAKDVAYGKYPPGSWKCNCFVELVINEAGVGSPYIYGPDASGIQWPPVANDWANPNLAIPGWIVVGSPQRGDVAAFPRAGDSGHVGIFVGGWGRTVIGAQRAEVVFSNSHYLTSHGLGFLVGATGPVVYRRYVGLGEGT